MVGFVLQEGKKDSPASRFLYRLFRGLNRYENRIDLRQDMRIVKRKHPAPIVRVVIVEDPQASDGLLGTKAFAPYLERHLGVQFPLVCQVVRIKDQGLPFRVENSSKSTLVLAIAVPVVHIDDVEIARDHKVAYFA